MLSFLRRVGAVNPRVYRAEKGNCFLVQAHCHMQEPAVVTNEQIRLADQRGGLA